MITDGTFRVADKVSGSSGSNYRAREMRRPQKGGSTDDEVEDFYEGKGRRPDEPDFVARGQKDVVKEDGPPCSARIAGGFELVNHGNEICHRSLFSG